MISTKSANISEGGKTSKKPTTNNLVDKLSEFLHITSFKLNIQRYVFERFYVELNTLCYLTFTNVTFRNVILKALQFIYFLCGHV